jgi:hypothetical protein
MATWKRVFRDLALGAFGPPAPRGWRREPYTGAELREIRRSKGVGRPPALQIARVLRLGWVVVFSAATGKSSWFRNWRPKPGPAARRLRRKLEWRPS